MAYQLQPDGAILQIETNTSFRADDPDNADYQAYQAWLVAGNVPESAVPPATEELIAANVNAIQREMDRQAKANGYDNIVSACSYAAQASGAPFQAEGAAFLKWRSDVWTQAHAVLADVQAGTRAMPTPAEAVAMMPALVLP